MQLFACSRVLSGEVCVRGGRHSQLTSRRSFILVHFWLFTTSVFWYKDWPMCSCKSYAAGRLLTADGQVARVGWCAWHASGRQGARACASFFTSFSHRPAFLRAPSRRLGTCSFSGARGGDSEEGGRRRGAYTPATFLFFCRGGRISASSRRTGRLSRTQTATSSTAKSATVSPFEVRVVPFEMCTAPGAKHN